nr:putative ribonuclease H-like domain-containing protein [Tanacetum cinerariifolium]
MKIKFEALKEQAKVSRPIKAFTVSSQRADLSFKTNQSVDGVPSQYTCNACPQGASNKILVIEQLKDQVQSRGNTIHELRERISRLIKKHSDADPIHDLKAVDSQNKELHVKVNSLYDLNERWRAKNEKVKRHYKELYDSIKITRAPHNRNNKEVHQDYLKHLKESVATLCQIVEEQNDVVERQNHTLVEAVQTMLIFSKALMFLWAKAVAATCYTQNRSFIYTRHNKTPYELVHDKKPDLTFFRVFAPYVPPTNKDLKILFQQMFDEYLEPPRVERPVSPAPAVPVLLNTAAKSTIMEENPLAPIDNDPFVNMFALEPSSKALLSRDVSSAASTYVTKTHYH